MSGQKGQVGKTVHWQAEPFKTGFGAMSTIIKVAHLFTEAIGFPGKEDILQWLAADIADGSANQRAKIQIAVAAHKKIVISASTRFLHALIGIWGK